MDDLGVVDDDAVSRSDIFREIGEVSKGAFSGFPVHNQHPGILPPLGRVLRDEFFRQVIVVF